MVYDYPSRADKYSTIIIDDEKDAIGKETYLVIKDGKIAPDNMPVWIYKKDIKDVGRPEVRVPMEYDGLSGWQRKLAEAIKLSLELYPRKTLIAAKNYLWEPNDNQRVKQDLVVEVLRPISYKTSSKNSDAHFWNGINVWAIINFFQSFYQVNIHIYISHPTLNRLSVYHFRLSVVNKWQKKNGKRDVDFFYESRHLLS
jgi:hypothetical protein